MSSKNLAEPTLPFKFQRGQFIIHRNNDFYVVTGLPDEYRIEATGEPAYAYRKLDSDGVTPIGVKWIRAQSIMEDEGRFTATGFMSLDVISKG